MYKLTYISTSPEEFKKIGTEVFYDDYGYGKVYWKEIAEHVIFGMEGTVDLGYGTKVSSNNDLKGMLVCTDFRFTDVPDKRINKLDSWDFSNSHFGTDKVKEFTDKHITLIRKDALDASKELKEKYNYIVPVYHHNEHPVFNYEEYEKCCNRYVTQYQLFGITFDRDPIMEEMTVDWFDRDAIEFIEKKMRKFIKIAVVRTIQKE